MKILIDARLYGLENAGLGRYIMDLVRELVKIDKGNNYVIFLRKTHFSQLKFPKNWKKILTDFRHYSISEQIFLPHYIYKEKADLVHFPHFNVPLFYFGKYVVTIHDLLMHRFKGREVTTRSTSAFFLKRLGYKLVFRKAVKQAFKILVPSLTIKKELMNYYKISQSKVDVTYEGLDERIINFKLKNDDVLGKYGIKKPYLIYVGNAYPHKNLDKAINAVKIFNTKGAQLNLIIISPRGVFVERLKKKIVNFKAEKYVRIFGYVPDNELGFLLKNSLGFIYPSLSEGFGLQGIEAMAAGTLLLASDIPVFREVYKNQALYFDPISVDSIISCLKKVMQMNEGKREKMITAGKSFIKRYSWSRMAKQTLKVYESCSCLRQG